MTPTVSLPYLNVGRLTLLLPLLQALIGCSGAANSENDAVDADAPASTVSTAPSSAIAPDGIPEANPVEASAASDDTTVEATVTDEEVATHIDAASGGPTSAQVSQAIQWFINHNGSTSYEGYCEKAVEAAFGRSGVFASAKAAYGCAQKKGLLHLSRTADDSVSIPRGATLFYNTSANYHVALFEGYYTQKGKAGGRVRSTSVEGKIGQTLYPYFQRPLGWAVMDWPHLTRECK